jgi:hypothetical protein
LYFQEKESSLKEIEKTDIEEKFLDVNEKNYTNYKNTKSNVINQNENSDICDICFTEKKTTVFYPCKHAVCCLNCTLKLIYQRSCPLCRGSITLFA